MLSKYILIIAMPILIVTYYIKLIVCSKFIEFVIFSCLTVVFFEILIVFFLLPLSIQYLYDFNLRKKDLVKCLVSFYTVVIWLC